MGGTLDPKEREYVAEVKRRSKKAFDGATRLLRNDTRWHLIQAQAERAVPKVIFHDEFRSSVVGDQLVMYIPESLLDAARLPDRAILYVWSNVFHPITTLSFFWDCNKATKSYRGYFLPEGPEVDRSKRAPIILAFIADNRSEVLQAFEIDLRPVTCFSQGSTPELRYVSDVEAARLYVMDNSNKPLSDSSPELWLRHGYITRLYREVEEGILCIAENDFVETIPEEAARLKVQGLECYVSFPYHREVYSNVS